MPLIGVHREIVTGELIIIPQRNLPITTNWNLVWLQKKKLSPVAEAFLEYVNTDKERVMQTHFQWLEEY